MDGSIIAILFLIFVLLWASARYKDGFWGWIDNAIYYIDDYYKRAFKQTNPCFPVTEITKYTKTTDECTPCVSTSPPPPDNSSNVFNINCGSDCKTGGASSCPPLKSSGCGCETEAVFGDYKYVLDKLPGTIFKFKIDCNGCPDPSTKETILHSLGRLVRIYVSGGNLIVEDIHSVEHTAIVNPSTGSLTF